MRAQIDQSLLTGVLPKWVFSAEAAVPCNSSHNPHHSTGRLRESIFPKTSPARLITLATRQ